MIKRKKILLATKDVKSRTLEDFNITIQLNRTGNIIIPNTYDNIFDINKHYDKERNNCRNFRIYGTIQSAFEDCDELILHVFKERPLEVDGEVMRDMNYITSVKTRPLISNSWENKNIFNYKKGKYIIELENYNDSDYVYIYIEGISESMNNLIKKQLIYRYETIDIFGKNKILTVPFGTNESIVDVNGNVITINNDFDYFYNKHWVKEDIILSLIRATKWIPDEETLECIQDNGVNTGVRHYKKLKEIFIDTGKPTGATKDNVPTDEDYYADIVDFVNCPPPLPPHP